MTKFTPKFIGVTSRPVLIVGEKPGTTRDGSTFSLVGNRTGDFVAEAIGDSQNIILTNVSNILYSGPFDRVTGVADGVIDIIDLIEKYNPIKIICLGSIAEEYIRSIKTSITVFCMPHPSWINRFQSKLRPEYVNTLRNEIIERVQPDQDVGSEQGDPS